MSFNYCFFFGQLTLHCCSVVFTAHCALYRTSAKYVTRLNTDGCIPLGLAQLNRKIFIVCVGRPDIIVFDAYPPYRRLADIAMGRMGYPWDIAACTVDNRIYVSDVTCRCLWMCSWRAPGAYAVTNLIDGIHGDATVSAIPDGNILLLEGMALNI